MKNIYIENGDLTRKDNTIKLVKNGKITWIPIKKIKEVNCVGGCTITNEFLGLMREHKISVHIYSYYGKYVGSFHNSRINKNGKVLYKQSRVFEEKKVELSKKIIEVVIFNMMNYLKQYNKKANETSKKCYEKLASVKEKIKKANSRDEVMGLEGVSWNIFYAFLKDMYGTFNFTERKKRPPTDPINSLISFLNTLLYNRLETEFSRTDIYTEISFLHSEQQKRNSLVLDIAELYKIDVTVRIIGKLINKKMVKKEDFVMVDGVCVMNENTLKLVIQEFEEYLKKRFWDENLKRFVTLENSMKLESYKLLKLCLEGVEYKPVKIGELKLEK